MSKEAEFDRAAVGNMVEVGGMRGHVREIKGERARVAAGRTDHGIWLPIHTLTVVYRGEPI